ncbi:MAG: DUF937 domain-containing protein [Halocynthiibacter sp.]
MSLLNLLKQAQGGQGLGQLAGQLGLDEAKTSQLTELLAPAIGSAAKQRAQTGGLQDLLGSLQGEAQGEMFDNVAQATAPQGQAQGMDFLKNLLGSEEATQGVAQEAAAQTGIDFGDVMKLLPALGAMAQGGLQKNLPDSSIGDMLGGLSAGGQQSGGGLMGMIGGLLGGAKNTNQSGGLDLSMLTNLLDADGDGSALDDVIGKFMK